MQRRTRRPPLAPIGLGNQYDATLEDMLRTNNSMEGWHRGFEALTTRYHHFLWDVTENFRREQGLTELMVEQDYAGGPPPQKRRRVITVQDNLVSVVLQYKDKVEQDDVQGCLHIALHTI